MKNYPIRWMRLARMLVMWVIFYIFITFGLFWFPENAIRIGQYDITQQIVIDTIFVLVIAKSINMVLRTFLWDYLIARMLKGLTPYLLIQISSLLIYFISFLFVIGMVFGESVAGFLTTFGAVGVVIGFGVQRLVLDAFSGVSINIDSPFSLGDFILVKTNGKDFLGRVIGISWRLTTIETDEGTQITFPNGVISGNPIVNFSRPHARTEFEQIYYFPLHFDENRIREVLMNAVLSVVSQGYIQNTYKQPQIRFSVLEPGRMGFKIKYWVDPLVKGGPGKAKNFLHSAVMKHVKYSELEFYNPNLTTLVNEKIQTSGNNKDLLVDHINLFSALSIEEKKIFSQTFLKRNYGKGHVIVKENRPDSFSMFIINEGFVEIFVHNQEKQSDLHVATLGPGDFFGEMALLTGEKRKATVVCGTDVCIFEVTKESVSHLLEKNEQLYAAFALTIAKRNSMNMKNLQDSLLDGKQQTNLVDVYLESIKNFFLK